MVNGNRDQANQKNFNKVSCDLKLESQTELCTQLHEDDGTPIGELKCTTTYHYTWECSTGGSEGGSETGTSGPDHEEVPLGGGSTAPTLPASEEIVQVVVQLEGQDLCIYNKMNSLKLFVETIGAFSNNKSYTLKIGYGECNSTEGEACTDGNNIENGEVLIKFESRENTPLNFASNLLHEGIHAELFKYVHEFKTGVDPSQRKLLLDYYFFYNQETRYMDTFAQHQYMADKFVKPIAEAIRTLDGNRFNLEYYMGFGWDGLRAYGYDGYWSNGEYISLSKGESTDYYIKQKMVLESSLFPQDCP